MTRLPLTPARRRGRATAVAIPLAAVLAVVLAVPTSPSSAGPATRAAPLTPVPVQADPDLVEVAPTSDGGYLAWEQYAPERPGRRTVTFGPYQLNAPGTSGRSPAFAAPRGYYLQQRGRERARIYVFDLWNEQDKTAAERRQPLPPEVNGPTYRGQPIRILGDLSVTAYVPGVGRGDRLAYRARVLKGRTRTAYTSVMLWTGTSGTVRELTSYRSATTGVQLGQLKEGRVAWVVRDLGDGAGRSTDRLVLRDTTTGRQESYVAPAGVAYTHPAVSRNGAVYYWRHAVADDEEARVTHELVRQPGDGAPVVIASVIADPGAGPADTFVRDQGRTFAVFYSFEGDVYRVRDPFLRQQP